MRKRATQPHHASLHRIAGFCGLYLIRGGERLLERVERLMARHLIATDSPACRRVYEHVLMVQTGIACDDAPPTDGGDHE